MSEAFRRGELSYSKARSLTRLATPQNEQELLDYALSATALQVENHCRELRNARRRESTRDVNQVHQQRCLYRHMGENGGMSIHVELTREAGELVMKALEIAAAAQAADDQRVGLGVNGRGERDRDRNGDPLIRENAETLMARQADALVAMAQSYLAGGSDNKTTTADHYQVMVHVDEAALREDPNKTNKSDLPLESIRRLCCDSSIVAVTEDEKGMPLNVGRKHRVIQPALRRALAARDGSCRFPGCTHDKWLDGHHIKHWVNGGETSLANTLLLCSRHPRLLHEGGFAIKKNYEGNWYFVNARGKTIPDGPVYRLTKSVTNPSREGLARTHKDTAATHNCS